MSGFLQEDNGNSSTIRLIPLLLIAGSIYFGTFAVVMNSELAQEITQAFLLAATGGTIAKVVQKPFESKVVT